MFWNSRNVFAVLACALVLGLLVGPGHTQESQKAKGQAIANELMEQWKRANPDRGLDHGRKGTPQDRAARG